MRRLCDASRAGKRAEAEAHRCTISQALHRTLFCESNPIPVKWAVEQMGLIGPGIRLPLAASCAAVPCGGVRRVTRGGCASRGRVTKRFSTALAASLLFCALAGCGRDDTVACEPTARYATAISAPPVRIPDDLSPPDETNSLRLPAEPGAGAVAPPRGCLESPPGFYADGAPVGTRLGTSAPLPAAPPAAAPPAAEAPRPQTPTARSATKRQKTKRGAVVTPRDTV